VCVPSFVRIYQSIFPPPELIQVYQIFRRNIAYYSTSMFYPAIILEILMASMVGT